MDDVTAQVLDALPHAVFIVDSLRPGRHNAYVNGAYSALTGYSSDEALAAGFDALTIFADAAAVEALGIETRSGARVSLRRRDGTTLTATFDVRPLRYADGRQYVLGLLERQAPSPAAGAAAGGNGAFLSWLNHELRSPLNACVMWLDVLTLAPQPDKLAKAVDAIRRNLARQTRLVNDLSDAAKVLDDAIELRREPVDLAALVRRSLDGWQSLAGGKQLELHHRVELESANVVGDSDRLLQALNHLLESAIASSPSASHVELRLTGANGQCSIELEDSGAPLTAEDAENLGAPLWRAAHSAKTRAGLGLGLAVAHHVASKHGGSLTATSGAERTRFVLTLPLAT